MTTEFRNISVAYVPVLSIQIGEEFNEKSFKDLTPVPPEWVKNFTYLSNARTFGQISLTLFDPDFEKLETMILENELDPGEDVRPNQVFRIKFGLAFPDGKVEWTKPIHCMLQSYMPSFSAIGMELSLEMSPYQIGVMAKKKYRNKSFTGKRSDVIKQIAALDNWEADVEETGDSRYFKVRGKNNPEKPSQAQTEKKKQIKQWPVKNMELSQFINTRIIPGAFSKVGKKKPYRLVWDESGRKVMFAPNDSPKLKMYKDPEGNPLVFKFTCLYGTQADGKVNSQVKEWKPDFQADALGSLAGAGSVIRLYNPDTKQYETVELSPNEIEGIVETGDVSHHVNRDKLNSIRMNGYTTYTPEDARAVAESNFAELMWSFSEGILDLHGDAHTMKMRAGDDVELLVVLPSGKTHWSSGLWRADEVTHTIDGTYSISCKLVRTSGMAGKTPVKPENKPKPKKRRSRSGGRW